MGCVFTFKHRHVLLSRGLQWPMLAYVYAYGWLMEHMHVLNLAGVHGVAADLRRQAAPSGAKEH
eukprot:1160088-Pelagomonas_calceolata.AAC.13